MSNHLRDLLDLGQSIWLDFISRDLISSGTLKRMIDEDGLRGMTSNPAIFQKAVSGSAYDEEIAALGAQGLDGRQIFDRLAIADVAAACDAFRTVYEASGGHDGFVSIEVSPHLAYDADATLVEARRIFAAVGRPNVLIKIPGTKEGLPAVYQALREGINVNITLLFSLHQYLSVADAYVRALEDRLAAGERIDTIASVASFFVSRSDTLVDSLLDEKMERADEEAKARLAGLHGKLGIANSKIVYQHFREILAGDRWQKLAAAGARPQRVLWASTSTKNPAYRDVLYVEELIGPDTVNTLPETTYEAFKDHGVVARTVDKDVEAAHAHMAALAAVGIDLDAANAKLLADGVDLFIEAYEKAVDIVEGRRAELSG